MELRSWKYQRCWRTIPLWVKNTTTFLTSGKQEKRATQLELSRTLENNSFVSQEYYSPFHFKEAKESNNAAGIVKNAKEHFLCQSTILQSLQLQGSKRMKQHSWNYQERWTTIPLGIWVSRIIQRLHVHQRRIKLARKLDISSVSQGFYIVQVYRMEANGPD